MAFLPGWSWIINARGYANIVQDLTTGVVTPTVALPNLQDSPSSSSSSETNAIDTAQNANAVQGVFGAIYTLSPRDEARLDRYEGVPWAYTKEVHRVALRDARNGNGEIAAAAEAAGEDRHAWIEALVYVDWQRVAWGPPNQEYVFRIRSGVDDAIEAGMDKDWGESMVREMMQAFEGR